jgi:hypothetical protein
LSFRTLGIELHAGLDLLLGGEHVTWHVLDALIVTP